MHVPSETDSQEMIKADEVIHVSVGDEDMFKKLKQLSKPEIVKMAGYKNMKALCKDMPDMRKANGKAPSKGDIIKLILY